MIEVDRTNRMAEMGRFSCVRIDMDGINCGRQQGHLAFVTKPNGSVSQIQIRRMNFYGV